VVADEHEVAGRRIEQQQRIGVRRTVDDPGDPVPVEASEGADALTGEDAGQELVRGGVVGVAEDGAQTVSPA
jgi:hypothetical protein